MQLTCRGAMLAPIVLIVILTTSSATSRYSSNRKLSQNSGTSTAAGPSLGNVLLSTAEHAAAENVLTKPREHISNEHQMSGVMPEFVEMSMKQPVPSHVDLAFGIHDNAELEAGNREDADLSYKMSNRHQKATTPEETRVKVQRFGSSTMKIKPHHELASRRGCARCKRASTDDSFKTMRSVFYQRHQPPARWYAQRKQYGGGFQRSVRGQASDNGPWLVWNKRPRYYRENEGSPRDWRTNMMRVWGKRAVDQPMYGHHN